MQLARERVQAKSGVVGRIIEALLKPYAQNPEPLLTALNIAMPKPAVKTQSLLRLRRGRSAAAMNPIGKPRHIPIGQVATQVATLLAAQSQPPTVLPPVPPLVICWVYFQTISLCFKLTCSPSSAPGSMPGSTPPMSTLRNSMRK